jgi:hypothetical protein
MSRSQKNALPNVIKNDIRRFLREMGLSFRGLGRKSLLRVALLGGKRVGRALDKARTEIKRTANKITYEVAVESKNELTRKLLDGEFKFAPLSPAYAKRKAQGWGNRPILVKTMEYAKSITVRRMPGGATEVAPPAAKLGQAMRLELGSEDGTTPPRPHWAPTFATMHRVRAARIAGAAVNSFIRNITTGARRPRR